MIAAAQLRSGRSRSLVSQPQQQLFMAILALLFAASATLTMFWSMSSMGVMPMPGGWSMSMMWMRMPGQTWLSAGASFVEMWLVMMVAMMLPSLLPMLLGFRQAVSGVAIRVNYLTAIMGAGYFLVWTLLGIVLFPLGVMLATIDMHHPALARAVPITTGAIIVIAGALQFTQWKAHHLACCREATGCHGLHAHSSGALRHGLELGLQCAYCCVGLTAILAAAGVMDLRLMIIVAGAITAERLAPNGQRVARAIGAVAMVAGVLLIARAIVVS